MLKKQTVWLLTMLSLMVVLSAYYLISPSNNDLAAVENGEPEAEETMATATGGTAETEQDTAAEDTSGTEEEQATEGTADAGEENTTEETSGTEEEMAAEENGAEVNDIANTGEDELFTTIRMEVQDERSMEKDRLTDMVASSSTSTDEKNQALESIDTLEEVSTKESILEDSIIGANGYSDVLVRSEEDKVHVHLKTEELSSTEAVNVMQMVRDEFGEVPVDVNFQPTDA